MARLLRVFIATAGRAGEDAGDRRNRRLPGLFSQLLFIFISLLGKKPIP
jgi:hypothetical protein